MPRVWIQEFRRLGVGAALLFLVGVFTNLLAECLLVGAVAYLAWHLRQHYLLHRWIVSQGGVSPPPARGIWSPVAQHLQRLRRQNRKRKKRLRKAITRFRQAAQATPDGAVILRASEEIEWLNQSATRLLGLRYPQDVDQRISNLVRTPAFAEYLSALAYDEPLEIPSPVNEMMRLLLRVVPYGRDRRLILVRDVTRLHKLEEMRRDFVANVSHELRSPLTVVLGYLETMEDDEIPEQWVRPREQMEQHAQRMRHIVEDLLRLSNIENDPGGAARDEVQVAEMLENIRADGLSLCEGRRTIHLDADRELRMLGDYNELYSAFSNLVFNAVQYTTQDGEVHITWASHEDGARMEVKDSGMGIDTHHIPRLTERFYRVDKARSRELGGTGLGLAIVKHVLMRHDGVLAIESELGEGSCFTCDFPRSRVCRASCSPAFKP